MATKNYVANFNLTSWANAQAQLNSGNPQDVTVPIMDENGNIKNVTVPNRGMFQKRVWDDVGGALGQFYRVFYVDAENGDDNNDGSKEHPFKTIKKTVNSVPVGGIGVIYLKSDITLEDAMYVNNKMLLFKGYGDVIFQNKSFKDDQYGTKTSGFICDNSYISFSHLTIKTADYYDSDDKDNSNYFCGIINRRDITSNNLIVVENCYVELGDTPFMRQSDRSMNSVIFYYKKGDYSINCRGANVNAPFIYNENGVLNVLFRSLTLGTKNDGDTDLTINDLITGIIRDGDSGNPINILSNVNFSS